MNLIHRLFIAATLTAALGTNALAADSYSIDTKHTFPVFEVSHLGFSSQRGRFNNVTGKISLDPASAYGKIDIQIDVNSLDMGFAEWDQHMLDAKFFNAKAFPTMTFKADKLSFDAGKLTSAQGSLTLLGVTKPVTLAVNHFKCGMHPMLRKEMCGADVTTTIKRSDFGMSAFLPTIGDDIKIAIAVEAFKD